MKKKTLLILSVFSIVLLLFSGIVFANTEENTSNNIKNGINNAGSAVVDGATKLGNDVKTGVNDMASDVVDGAENLGDDVRDGIGNAENGIEGALKMNTSSSDRMNTGNRGNYTVTRTTGDATGTETGLTLGNSTTWIWIILAIAAVIVVALIWYYATQNTTNHNHHDE